MNEQLPQNPAPGNAVPPAPGNVVPPAPGNVVPPAPVAPAPGVPVAQSVAGAPAPGAPVAQPGPAFAFPTGQHNKVHHSYIWLSPLLGLGAAVIIGSLSSIESVVQGFMYAGEVGFSLLLILLFAILGFAVLYAIVVGVTALAYKHLSFVFDETEFSLYSGILTKRRVHVPYARVQSVNHKQSIVQRVAGVCTVEIDTAGGASNKAIKVPYVKLNVGEAIRADLFMRKAYCLAAEAGQPLPQAYATGQVAPGMAPQAFAPGQVAPGMQAQAVAPGQAYAPAMGAPNLLDEAALGVGVDNFRGLYGGNFAGLEPISFERRLDNKELLLASASNGGMSAVAGVGITVALMAAILAPLTTFLPIGTKEILMFLPIIILSIIGLIVFTLLMGMLTTALSYGSFSVRRRGSRVEVERGILQRDFSGIDVNRIQSVVIRQSLIRKIMGYCEVSLGRIRAGSGEEQSTQANLNAGALVVHPFLKLDQVDGLLNGLLPEYADRPISTQFKGLPAVALRRGFLRRCLWHNALFWVVLCCIVTQIIFNVFFGQILAAAGAEAARVLPLVNMTCVFIYLCFVVQAALIIVGTIWWKRGSGFAMTEKYLALCNDGLGTETVYLPRQKIQDVYTRTNPFQRSAGVTTIGALTAAGVQGTTSFLWDVSEEDGAAWLDWLKPRTQATAQAPERG